MPRSPIKPRPRSRDEPDPATPAEYAERVAERDARIDDRDAAREAAR